MSTQPRRLGVTEEELVMLRTGASATFVMAHVKPIIADTAQAALGRLKAMHRGAKWDPAQAQAEVAALCVCDELLERLFQQINTAQGTERIVREREEEGQ